MIESQGNKQQEQLKRFNFFESEKVQEKVDDPKSHPIKLTDISISDVAMIGPRYFNIYSECFY